MGNKILSSIGCNSKCNGRKEEEVATFSKSATIWLILPPPSHHLGESHPNRSPVVGVCRCHTTRTNRVLLHSIQFSPSFSGMCFQMDNGMISDTLFDSCDTLPLTRGHHWIVVVFVVVGGQRGKGTMTALYLRSNGGKVCSVTEPPAFMWVFRCCRRPSATSCSHFLAVAVLCEKNRKPSR